MPRIAVLAAALLLAGCMQPRAAPLTYAAAGRDRLPRMVQVVRVWDGLTDKFEGHERDGRITHYVELDVLHPGQEPVAATWPYDEHATGRRPPRPGSELVVSPADFLSPAADLLRRRP